MSNPDGLGPHKHSAGPVGFAKIGYDMTQKAGGVEPSFTELVQEFVKVTRKALADISNVGGKTLRIPTPCGSITKISVRPGRVLDNSLKIHTKEHEIKRTSKVGNNRIYKTGQKFIDNKILSLGTTAGGPRKYLPVVKRTSLTDQSLNKVLDMSEVALFQLVKDRNNQNKNTLCIARKSVKIQKTVKTSLRNSSAPKKPPVGRSKSRSISSTPSEEAASALTLPEKVETEGLKEDTQGESSSNDKADPTTKVLDVTAKSKSERRKSFTSLLVSGSKFDEKNGDNTQPEKLPSIDDESNELEVAEYVEDIYQFYLALNPAIGCYLSAQTEVTPILRGIMIDWLIEIEDLISISAYTRDQILGMPEQLAFYLIELTLVEYEALKFKPSLLCASAVYVARCTVHLTPAWTSLLKKHTHYNVREMRECSEMILKFHKVAKTGKLRVAYEKYMNPDRSNVAVLTLLD
ncbi:unnamed protein product [Cochlearia groenlandica]